MTTEKWIEPFRLDAYQIKYTGPAIGWNGKQDGWLYTRTKLGTIETTDLSRSQAIRLLARKYPKANRVETFTLATGGGWELASIGYIE